MTTYVHTCPECGYEHRSDEDADHRVENGDVSVRVPVEATCDNDACDIESFTDPAPTAVE